MKLHEAKQASSEAIKRSRKNGDRVEEIMREADAVEGEVQKFIRRYTQRLKRFRDKLAERLDATAAEAEIGDVSATKPDAENGQGSE